MKENAGAMIRQLTVKNLPLTASGGGRDEERRLKEIAGAMIKSSRGPTAGRGGEIENGPIVYFEVITGLQRPYHNSSNSGISINLVILTAGVYAKNINKKMVSLSTERR